MDNGTFYALGVGPGDPELLTRKACRILSGCPVIAAPRTASGEMLALDIAKGAVDLTGKEILPLEFAMARQVSARQAGYRKAAEQIAAVLESGRDVAMVNLGDVSIYATAYYVLDVVRGRLSKIAANASGGALVMALTLLFYRIGFGHHLDLMSVGALLPLIPGVAFTNSIRDFADQDYISGSVRLLDTMIVIFSIALGVGLVMIGYHHFVGGAVLP